MKKIFFLLIALLTGFMYSCKNNLDFNLGNDCVITGFTLGEMQRTMHTTDSKGEDSTYIIRFQAGKEFPMTIDQISNKIYNLDSLPYGTNPKNALVSISSIGSIAYALAGQPEPKWTIYSSSDSIDFSHPLVFRVASNEESGIREYEVKINIHQVDGEQFVWHKVAENVPLESMEVSKAIFWKGQIMVYSQKHGETFLTTPLADNRWEQAVLDDCKTAIVRSLVQNGTYLFMNTTDGKILKSEDGHSWTETQPQEDIKQLFSGNKYGIYARTASGIAHSTDHGKTWNDNPTDTEAAWLPDRELTGISYTLDNGNEQTLLAGNRTPGSFAADTTAQIWSTLTLKNGTHKPWIYYTQTPENKYFCPNLANLELLYYNNSILAMGGETLNGAGIAYQYFYTSKDQGITWKKEEQITLPKEIAGTRQYATATTDQEHFIWLFCGNKLWKGRLNKLGFERQ